MEKAAFLDFEREELRGPDNGEREKPLALLFSKSFKSVEDEIEDEDESPGENGKFMPKKHELSFDFFGHQIKIVQDPKECCGGYLWRAETVVLKYLETKSVFPENFWRDKYIVELGAGTGLLGLYMAKIGSKVLLTDQISMVPLMKQNVEINGLSEDKCAVAELFWGRTDVTPFIKEREVDYIIASDCIYLEVAFEPLVQTLWELSGKDTVTIVGYQKRRKADKRFWKFAQKKFDVIKVPTTVYADSISERVQICHLKKKMPKTEK